MNTLNFTSTNTLFPAIIQDINTGKVRMLGYMNREAYELTQKTGYVHFFSRSKNRIWKKGETSGHELKVIKILTDCDRDALLILAEPSGPTCHTGNESCFDTTQEPGGYSMGFLNLLEQIIRGRKEAAPPDSYVKKILESGLSRIAQKVGEEAVEVVIESLGNDREQFLNECADLIFHLLILVVEKNYSWSSIEKKLMERHKGIGHK